MIKCKACPNLSNSICLKHGFDVTTNADKIEKCKDLSIDKVFSIKLWLAIIIYVVITAIGIGIYELLSRI